MAKLFSAQLAKFTHGIFDLDATLGILKIIDVMTCSSLHWEWIDVVPFQHGLVLKWLTAIKEMVVRNWNNPSKA